MEKIPRFSPGNSPKYPWQRMLDEGGKWRMLQGTDYTATRVSVCNSAYSWAERHGATAHCHIIPTGVEIEIVRNHD